MLSESQKKALMEFTGRKIQIRPYSWTTGNDMVAVMEALVKKGVWDSFCGYALDVYEATAISSKFTDQEYGFTAWLFRSVDEQGEIHFCRLVCEWKGWK